MIAFADVWCNAVSIRLITKVGLEKLAAALMPAEVALVKTRCFEAKSGQHFILYEGRGCLDPVLSGIENELTAV